MDEHDSKVSNQVACARCRREPRDDIDLVEWEKLDEGEVCPGCLTLLELDRRQASQ